MERDEGFSLRQLAEGDPPVNSCDPPAFASLPTGYFWRICFDICSNLAACFTTLPKVPVKRAYASMFRSAYVQPAHPGRSLVASGLLHAGVIACLLYLPSLPYHGPDYRSRVEAVRLEHTVLFYSTYREAEALPTVSPPESKPATMRAREAIAPPALPKLAFAPVQEIISQPPKPDNQQQTIIQPEAPELQIPYNVEMPNLVRWTSVIVPPIPNVAEAQRQLAQIDVPKLPAPAVSPAPRPEAAPAPEKVQPPPPEPPKVQALNRKISEIDITAIPLAEAPKLDVPAAAPRVNLRPNPNSSALREERAVPSAAPPNPVPERAAAPLPSPPELSSKVSMGPLPNLIAVGIAPAPPQPQFDVPPGNRAGEFAVSPKGNENLKTSAKVDNGPASSPNGMPGPASPNLASQNLASQDLADIHVPDLSISQGKSVEPPSPVVAASPQRPPTKSAAPAAAPDLANLLAKATRPSLIPEVPRTQPLPDVSRGTPVETGFFGGRPFYTISINMPNLTSGSGSWILRFAEVNVDPRTIADTDTLTSPVAVRKVDPRYIPSAVRERVEGTVILAANILRDGTVANIRIMRSLDPRLDTSAMDALTDWKFLPAKKNGNPVDLEVLVQIPFRLPTF